MGTGGASSLSDPGVEASLSAKLLIPDTEADVSGVRAKEHALLKKRQQHTFWRRRILKTSPYKCQNYADPVFSSSSRTEFIPGMGELTEQRTGMSGTIEHR